MLMLSIFFSEQQYICNIQFTDSIICAISVPISIDWFFSWLWDRFSSFMSRLILFDWLPDIVNIRLLDAAFWLDALWIRRFRRNLRDFQAFVSPDIPLTPKWWFFSLSSFLLWTTRPVFSQRLDSCASLQSLLTCSFYATSFFVVPNLADSSHLCFPELWDLLPHAAIWKLYRQWVFHV